MLNPLNLQILVLKGLSTSAEVLLVLVKEVLTKAIPSKSLEIASKLVVFNVILILCEQDVGGWYLGAVLPLPAIDLGIDVLNDITHIVGAIITGNVGSSRRFCILEGYGPFEIVLAWHNWSVF